MKRKSHVFFTLIILLFSIFPSSAYDFQHEDIWVYKGSFELGPGEKATVERYTLKVYELDQEAAEPSAVILVYKNDDFKKAYYVDAGPNDQRVYDNDLKIKVDEISSGKISIVLYGHEFEKVWVLSTPKISLSKGVVIQDGAYSISLTNLSSKEVNISVTSPSGKYENVFALSDYKKYDNELMVRLVYIDKDRSKAFIETYRPGKPDVEVALSPSSDTFEADDPISCILRVTNNGTLSLRGIKIDNKASEGVFTEQALSLETLAPLQTVALTLGLEIPAAATGRSISVTTEVSGGDYSGDAYYATDTQDFFLGPYICMTKEIRGNNSLYGKNIASTHEQLEVILNLKNMNDLPVVLTVTDSVPESFVLQDTERLEWELQVDPHATNEISYIVSPHIPGNFTLGSAVASWRENGDVYEVASASPQLMVNGSYVVADKTVNTEYAMEGENVTVTLQVSNWGDQEVKVSMHDDIPEEADLVSGSLEWSAKLAPGETSTKSYNIVFSEAGEYALPALRVDYTDVQMKGVTVYSEQVEMYIDREVISEADEEPEAFSIVSVANEPQESEITYLQAASFLVSSFVVVFCIVAVIPVAVFFLIRKVYI
ncbi:MAG: Translocon-associated protein beta (TRAPB) [Methanomethylovorans sp. PtaU1.Bin093]|uniref:hypothetical protein n=1 Tax=Methanomethylovorans sp. PtaU1.Bin093 TaxID=1811679 RepID=UPI0009D24BF7|nr:hypothetical protein [Methanomethylovorans sp. PtaU1.Bin093]OPY20250.1 MAG: Translocon-associated protein beta (TRAPB) [Methanomethylovorans sp. PtaU1.Bin093]